MRPYSLGYARRNYHTRKRYLGDSVDTSRRKTECLKLTTDNGYEDDPRNVIFLDQRTYQLLVNYVMRKMTLIQNVPSGNQFAHDPSVRIAQSKDKKSIKMKIEFTVFGEPKTAGSKKAFYNPKLKRAFITDANAQSRDWKEQVASAARQEYSGDLLREALVLTLVFYRVRPQGHFKKVSNVYQKRSGITCTCRKAGSFEVDSRRRGCSERRYLRGRLADRYRAPLQKVGRAGARLVSISTFNGL